MREKVKTQMNSVIQLHRDKMKVNNNTRADPAQCAAIAAAPITVAPIAAAPLPKGRRDLTGFGGEVGLPDDRSMVVERGRDAVVMATSEGQS